MTGAISPNAFYTASLDGARLIIAMTSERFTQRPPLCLLARGVACLIVPGVSSEPLAQADYLMELGRNAQLQAASSETESQQMEDTRAQVSRRLRLLRSVLIKSFMSMASAIALALLVKCLNFGVPVPLVVVASAFCFAWATLGRLGWASQSWKGESSVERLDQVLFHVLYWLGMFLASMSVL